MNLVSKVKFGLVAAMIISSFGVWSDSEEAPIKGMFKILSTQKQSDGTYEERILPDEIELNFEALEKILPNLNYYRYENGKGQREDFDFAELETKKVAFLVFNGWKSEKSNFSFLSSLAKHQDKIVQHGWEVILVNMDEQYFFDVQLIDRKIKFPYVNIRNDGVRSKISQALNLSKRIHLDQFSQQPTFVNAGACYQTFSLSVEYSDAAFKGWLRDLGKK